MSDQPDPRALDRRGFLRLVAVAGAAAALPAVARAQAPTPPPATPPAAPPAASTAPATPAAPEAPKPPSEDARALAGILDRRYPGRFTPEQLAGFAKDFDGDLALSKRLRATRLANGDEPDFVFRP